LHFLAAAKICSKQNGQAFVAGTGTAGGATARIADGGTGFFNSIARWQDGQGTVWPRSSSGASSDWSQWGQFNFTSLMQKHSLPMPVARVNPPNTSAPHVARATAALRGVSLGVGEGEAHGECVAR